VARKTKKKIRSDLERLYWFKAECLKRNPDFQKDMQRFYSICCKRDSINKKMKKIKEIKLEIYKNIIYGVVIHWWIQTIGRNYGLILIYP
jgi:uncharacterized metal-binding protein